MIRVDLSGWLTGREAASDEFGASGAPGCEDAVRDCVEFGGEGGGAEELREDRQAGVQVFQECGRRNRAEMPHFRGAIPRNRGRDPAEVCGSKG